MSLIAVFQGDVEAAARAQKMLDFLMIPRTIEEVADEFEWHPQTAREKVWELKRIGRVRESTRKQERKKLWQSVNAPDETDEMLIVTSLATSRLSAFMTKPGTRRPLGDVIAESLAYVWRRAYYRGQDQDNVLNVAAQGTLNLRYELRVALETVYLSHKHYLEALERMLVDMPQLWDEDDSSILRMIGEVLEQPEALIPGDFEVWVRSFIENKTA